MLACFCRVLLIAGLLVLPAGVASAAPPASCAHKFIGTWVYPGGTTVVAPGGIAYPKCAMCVPTQTWTCQGSTYLFSNSGPPGEFSATLSADGRQLIGSGVVATRVGGAAPVGGAPGKAAASDAKQGGGDKKGAAPQKPARVSNAKPAEAKTQTGTAKSPPAAAPADALPRRTASCSDITGTSSAAPAASHCRDADRSLYAARQLRQVNPPIAAAEYKKAAAAARNAGDGTLELSILREAMEAAAAVAGSGSGASVGIPAAPAVATPSQPASGVRRMWDGSRETCETANKTERGTAAWYVMCTDPQPPARPSTAHRPNPDPHELSKAARQVCGSYSRETQQCFADFKLKAILASSPGLQETCERKAADRSPLRRQLSERLGGGSFDSRRLFLECVDNVYLYGSADGPPSPRNALRETLRKRLAAQDSPTPYQAPDGTTKRSICWSPGYCCQPGYGLKPKPGAFGAWSCQPLGLLALGTAQPPVVSKDVADQIDDLEDRVGETVAKAVAAALDAAGAAMSEADREACAAASFAAVHAMLKGGAPDIPERCRAMASGARAYFGSYAHGHVDTSNSAMEDLLASFAGNLGPPLPGMIGLTPDETLRRSGECLLRGGSHDCN
jgi:hypothetical protein